MLAKHGVRAEYFDEGAQIHVDLHHPDAMRKFIRVPEGVVDCEFLVSAPKFKMHPWTKVTFALKNYIGIQDDSQRLIDHDHMLHTKIADLQEVISPGFIAIDGIIAGEKTMLTPNPFPLHLIIMGINPVAVDSVCTHIVGLDPKEVDHIRISAERGYGPIELEEIEVLGDVSLEAAQNRAKDIELALDRVEQIFNNKSNITTYVGPPPDTYDYCWGGCPGSLYEAMQIINQFQPGVYNDIRPQHYVIGAYEGEIHPKPGERVFFMGDCAVWKGNLNGNPVDIPFLYTQREHRNPYKASSGDVVAKAIGVLTNLIRHRSQTAIRIKGCPVSVAENVLYAAWLGKTTNPYTHPKIIRDFTYYWFVSNIAKTLNRIKRLLSPKAHTTSPSPGT